MTPEEFVAARLALGLTQVEFTRLGYDIIGEPIAGHRTVSRWEGIVDPPGRPPANIALLVELLLRSAEARDVLGLSFDPAQLTPTQRRRYGK